MINNDSFQQNSNLLNFLSNEIYNIFIFKSDISINIDKLRKNIFKFISHLEINYNNLKIKKSYIKKKTIKLFFLEIKIEEKWFFDKKWSNNNYLLHYFNHNYYLYNNHFTTLSKIFKKNLYSKHNFNLLNIDLLNKLINNHCFINKKLYLELLNIELKQNNISDKNELVNLTNKLKENFTHLNQNNLSFLSICNNILKKFEFIENIDENKKIFFTFSFDFRGRLYYDSIFSPTNSKITRNSIHYGPIDENMIKSYFDYNDDETIKHYNKSKTLNILFKYINTIEFNIPYYSKIAVLWYLISIGKILNKKNKNIIHIEEFILTGKTWLYNNGFEKFNIDNSLSTDNLIELCKYYNIILSLIENKKLYKYTINKDATASGIQHLIKILKPDNLTSLKYCNMLSEDSWYDTYSHLIDNFFINNNIDPFFKLFFTRKSTKKTIMIENYGASKTKCYKDFLSNITIEDNSLKPQIKSIFNKLFDQLREQKLSNFYKNNFTFLLENDNYIFYLIDGNVNLSYNKTKKHQLSVKMGNKTRNTFQEILLTNEIDKKKSKTAFKANITHTSDAEICRRMYLKHNDCLYSIHDCFIVNVFNLHIFIDTLNDEMKKSAFINNNISNINENLYSPFIII